MRNAIQPSRGRSRNSTYLWLASFQFVMVFCAVYFGYAPFSAFENAVRHTHQLAVMNAKLNGIQRVASEIAAPGNDVFQSNDVPRERLRLNLAAETLHALLDDIGVRLHGFLDVGDEAAIFDAPLNRVRENLGAMMDESNRVFDAVAKQDMQTAGLHMAILDRNHRAIVGEINQISTELFRIQTALFDGELQFAAAIERYGSMVGLGGIALVLALSLHGFKLSNLAERAERRLALQVQEIERARGAAEEANRVKSAFLAVMSHEIRTPLNAMLGVAGLMSDTRLDGEQRRYVETMRSSGEALLALINDILDLSKLEAGRIELEILEFDPAELVEGVFDILAPRAGAKNIAFGLVLGRDLPGTVEGDPGRLRQILLNLVGNAIKFTATGGVTLEVRRRDDSDGAARIGAAELRFAVSDTGIGIALEAQPRLFERFSQGDPSIGRKFGGTGLGLAISRELVNMMGGTISVRSAPGAGSTFEIELPLALPNARSARQDGDLKDPDGDFTGLCVLVADPSEVSRRAIARQIAEWGADPVCAADAPGLLAALGGAAKPQIALIDASFLDPADESLRLSIRRATAGRDIRFVVMGSHFRPELSAESDWLMKPCLPSAIRRALRETPGVSALAIRGVPVPELAAVPSLRILLAEDNPVNQMVALGILRKDGHRVDVAANGIEALAAARERDYDVVLMDVRMPEMDGLEATREIRALPGGRGRVPIVALTASAMRGDRERFLDAGMDDYLAKPIDRAKLAAALRRIGRASEAAADTPGAFDETLIGEFVDAIGVGAFAELAASQRQDARARIARVVEAAAARDGAGLERESHDLKSTFATFGALGVRDLARDIEEHAVKGDVARAVALVPALEREVASSLDWLDKRVAELVRRAA